MKNFFKLLILTTVISSCVTQKLNITNQRIPKEIGIHLVNNANIQSDDWNYFTSATDSFINSYNLADKKFKLYTSVIDTNSVNINIVQNSYVTKEKQIRGALVTAAGILTPIILIAGHAPIIFAFWYAPRNNTLVYKSLSSNLDPTTTTIPVMIQSSHGFKDYNKQKERQKKAYSKFLTNLIEEIETKK